MKRILLSVPHMGGDEEPFVREAFASNWLSTVGPQLDSLQGSAVADYDGWTDGLVMLRYDDAVFVPR